MIYRSSQNNVAIPAKAGMATRVEAQYMNVIINSIDYTGSIVDGPGIRTVLYVQGCERKCYACHNPATWNISRGRTVRIQDLADELRLNIKNKKLTISGGEPLLQYASILELVKKMTEFDIVLYTGFELNEVPKEILKYLRYIKVGKYIDEERCTTVPYVGSRNQKFIELRGGSEV